MASTEPSVENRRWAVNHQSRGVCCGCCGRSGTCGCCAGGIGLLILIPHSYWPQTDRSHVQYSSRIRHGVSIALGMGKIINGQGMIYVNQSPCRESPLLCGIVVGRHAILPDFFAAAHTTPHMTDDAARRNGVIATIPQYNLWDGTNVHRLTFMPSHRRGTARDNRPKIAAVPHISLPISHSTIVQSQNRTEPHDHRNAIQQASAATGRGVTITSSPTARPAGSSLAGSCTVALSCSPLFQRWCSPEVMTVSTRTKEPRK